MKDDDKAEEQLIRELGLLRQRVAELKTSEGKHKRAEDALRESEDKYRAIFETTGTATILVDEDTTISLANTEFEELSGYSKEEVEGKKSWTDFVAHKDDLERMEEYHNLRRTDPNAAPREYEYKFIDRSGAVKEVFATVAMIPGTRKSVGSFLDITDRKKAEESLKESEEKYRSLVESTEDSIYLVDSECRYLFMNKKHLSRFSLPPDKIIGRTYGEFHSKEETKEFVEKVNEVFETGKSLRYEYRSQRDSGYFIRTLSPVKEPDLSIRAVTVASKDITELKRADHALRQSEERYRSVVEGSIEGILILQDSIVQFANQASAQIFGYSEPEELIGLNWRESLVASEEWAELKSRVSDTLNGKSIPVHHGWQGIRKDGTRIWIQSTASLISWKNRPAVLSFLIDITERKLAEEALRESERSFRDLVESSLTGIFIIQDDQIVYKNPEQERIWVPFFHPSTVIDFRNIHPDDVEKVKESYQRISSGEVRALDMDFRFSPQGKGESRANVKWVHWRASLIEYKGKEAILVNMMDVTRAKELEHLLRVQDKMSSLGRVAAGIAHEIRNPLSGINIYLKTLEKICDQGEGFEKAKEILGRLQSASSKIESVIRRVMDFSKPSEPRFAMRDINQPVEEAIKLSSVTLRKSGITLEKALTEDLPGCPIDPHMIEEVVLNLITNAAEAMKGKGGNKRIEIASSMVGDRILVSVSDSGPGVPPDLRDQIFDPFYTTKNGSTGIGLSLSHRIITDHGGSLGVLTSKWGGAEFMIGIPLERPTDQK